MTIKINLEPTLRQQIFTEAQQRGVELEQYIVQTLRDHSSSIQTTEATLLKKINEGFSDNFWQTYHRLIEKRSNYTIKKEELNHLIDMTEQLERSNLQRLKYLSELARLRGTDLRSLIDELGIKASNYA
ncbi:MAG: hypothetical protein AAF847_00440 [Bacteroidota bacterium]